jgi:FdhE protein
MAMEAWLSKHPYLRSIAEFHAEVSDVVATIPFTYAHIPNWHKYLDDYKKGISVLKSSHEVIIREEVQRIIASFLQALVRVPSPDSIKQQGMELHHEFQTKPRELTTWLLGKGNDAPFTPSHPGLLRHIGWTALAHYLAPLVSAFERWRDEELWMQRYCPVCGSGPSMAQLVGADPGRRRLLFCGCCRARWQFRRIGCPFCENSSDHELSALLIDEEKRLRIDYCHVCLGYLKTYNGEGQECLMLADWTSLHLDFLAKDRGLKRLATSLFEV